MMFSRQQPSQRYSDLVSVYRTMHVSQPNSYVGKSLIEHIPDIRRLVDRTGAETLLDYGSGKGLVHRGGGVSAQLGVKSVRCYDPAVPEHSTFPAGEKFDGVISTDALEHIPEDDIPWVLNEMFAAARKFVFATVAAFPAHKILPNGENAHACQNHWTWWKSLIETTAQNYPGVVYRFVVEIQNHNLKFLPMRRSSKIVTNG
jgi:hypothetical protein